MNAIRIANFKAELFSTTEFIKFQKMNPSVDVNNLQLDVCSNFTTYCLENGVTNPKIIKTLIKMNFTTPQQVIDNLAEKALKKEDLEAMLKLVFQNNQKAAVEYIQMKFKTSGTTNCIFQDFLISECSTSEVIEFLKDPTITAKQQNSILGALAAKKHSSEDAITLLNHCFDTKQTNFAPQFAAKISPTDVSVQLISKAIAVDEGCKGTAKELFGHMVSKKREKEVLDAIPLPYSFLKQFSKDSPLVAAKVIEDYSELTSDPKQILVNTVDTWKSQSSTSSQRQQYDINYQDNEGNILTHYFATAKQITEQNVNQLVDNLEELDLNIKINKQNNTLPTAIINNNTEKAIIFMDNPTTKLASVAGDDTDFACSINTNNIIVAKALYKKGAQTDRTNSRGENPAYTACYEGKIDSVNWLLENFPEQFQLPEKKYGFTAFDAAAYRGHLPVVQALYQAFPDKQILNQVGDKMLYLASQGGHLDVVRYLERVKADSNSTNQDKTRLTNEEHFDVAKYVTETGENGEHTDEL